MFFFKQLNAPISSGVCMHEYSPVLACFVFSLPLKRVTVKYVRVVEFYSA